MILKKITLLLFVLLIKLQTGFTQIAPFQKEYINTVGTVQTRSICEGPAGYFMGGMVQTGPPSNYLENFIMHTDKNGNPNWAYRYTDSLTWHIVQSVCANSDSGCTFAGSNTVSALSYLTIVRLDKNGQIIWKYRYMPGGYAYPKKIIQSADGGFVIVGEFGYSSSYYAMLMKIDASGNLQWCKKKLIYTAPVPSRNMDVLQTPDGGFTFFCMSYQSTSGADSQLIHTDGSGNIIWTKSYGGNFADWPLAMVRKPDGKYIVAMRYFQYSGPLIYDGLLLIFTDSVGNILASKWHTSPMDVRIAGMHLTASGNIIATGMMYGPNGPFYTCGVSFLFNPNGQQIDMKLYGDNDFEEFFATAPITGSGQIIGGDVLTGNINTLLLMKTDSALGVACNTYDTLTVPLPCSPITYSVQADDTLQFVRTIFPVNAVYFGQTVVHVCGPTGIEEENTAVQPAVFPNPSAGQFTIRFPEGNERWQVDVYDISGKCIRRIASEIPELQLNLEQEAAGMYLLRITRGTYSYSHKISIRR